MMMAVVVAGIAVLAFWLGMGFAFYVIGESMEITE